jgi:hypothetical protein
MNRKALEQAPGESRFLISKQTPRPLFEGEIGKEPAARMRPEVPCALGKKYLVNHHSSLLLADKSVINNNLRT